MAIKACRHFQIHSKPIPNENLIANGKRCMKNNFNNIKDSKMSKESIAIPKSFEIYIDAAIVRASYLYPNFTIQKSKDSMSVQISLPNKNIDFEKFRQDFLYVLYRERIYSETLPIRKNIYGAP